MSPAPSVTWNCPHCENPAVQACPPSGPLALRCPQCSAEHAQITLPLDFSACPLCRGSQFYRQKDFNRGLGCLIVLIGIFFVPVTHGLSLPTVALIDWLIYRKMPGMAVCYRCGGEFRGMPVPERFKPYMHHIGLKYDKSRTGSF